MSDLTEMERQMREVAERLIQPDEYRPDRFYVCPCCSGVGKVGRETRDRIWSIRTDMRMALDKEAQR